MARALVFVGLAGEVDATFGEHKQHYGLQGETARYDRGPINCLLEGEA